jgi:hypothetical protein
VTNKNDVDEERKVYIKAISALQTLKGEVPSLDKVRIQIRLENIILRLQREVVQNV